ncbi:MAG: MATE family efflux transporter [Alphaproteobacteria bacterium]|nr:MATE family efflux transporter [Alphaproteobacteria bacterium]
MSQIDSPLTQGSVPRHVFRLCLPPMLGLGATFSYYIADAYFIAKLGIEPLASFAFLSPICFTFITIAVALGIGTTSILSYHVGKVGVQASRPMMRDSFILALSMALIFFIIGYNSLETLFRSMGATGDVLAYTVEYMQIWYVAMIFIFIHIVSNNIIRASTGRAGIQAFINVVSALMNVVLNPILIFGWWIFPAYGIVGSAYATLIASIFTVICMVALILYHRLLIWQLPNIRIMLLTHWRPIMPVFLFALLENTTPPIIEAFLIVLITPFGTEAVAAVGIISRLFLFLLTPFISIFIGLTPFIGQNWGAGYYNRAREAFLLCLKIALTYWALMVVIMFFTAGMLASQFNTDPIVLDLVQFFFRYVYITVIGLALIYLTAAVCYGIQKPLYPCMLQLSEIFMYFPIALLLREFYGVKGMMAANWVSLTLIGIGALLLLRHVGFLVGKPIENTKSQNL